MSIRETRAVVRQELLDGEPTYVLENGLVQVVVSPAHGAAILQLVHLPSGVQLLWRAPEALRGPGQNLPAEYDQSTSFFDFYPGGGQLVLPNGGPSVRYNGVELGFHGEACKIAWTATASETSEGAAVHCKTSLRRAPLEVELSYSLAQSASSICMETRVRNLSNAAVDCMWGFHPAYGEPFLGTRARLHVRAGVVESHPEQFAHRQLLEPGFTGQWPVGPDGLQLDYLFPGDGPTADLMYLRCRQGWYVLHNEDSGLAATMTWDAALFPFVWLWQECHDEAGYPWFGRYHIVGVEPFTSYPSSGLLEALKRDTALQIAPNASISTTMRLGATVFSPEAGVVAGVSDKGVVNITEGEERG